MKAELGGKIMTEFVLSRPETYNYLTYENNEYNKQKTQKSVSKKENLNLKIIDIV